MLKAKAKPPPKEKEYLLPISEKLNYELAQMTKLTGLSVVQLLELMLPLSYQLLLIMLTLQDIRGRSYERDKD